MKRAADAPRRIWFLSPVYFDVESYERLRRNLIAELERTSELAGMERRFIPVDDTAGADPAIESLQKHPDTHVVSVPFPLGHQRALVFGLRRLASQMDDSDLVVTLDADGEDQPEDMPRLLSALGRSGQLRGLALADRTQRKESWRFKVLYFLFKLLFVLLTGGVIRSGNYAAYRGWFAKNLLFHPHFDLCYSSSLLTFNLQIERVPCARGSRYFGRSKMTFLKLIMHGIRMLMPFADRIAVRGLVIFSLSFAVGVLLGIAVIAVRLFTDLAIPGWATYTLLFSLMLCGGALGCLILVFTLFVQSQSLSMSRLEAGRSIVLGAESRSSSHRPE